MRRRWKKEAASETEVTSCEEHPIISSAAVSDSRGRPAAGSLSPSLRFESPSVIGQKPTNQLEPSFLPPTGLEEQRCQHTPAHMQKHTELFFTFR